MLSVLIVDDEQIEREGMRAILQRAFPEVAIALAKHGQAAVELVPQLKPDLIIMDIKMPVMNGLEAIESISADSPHIRYIMVTAYDTFEYARQAIKLGVKDYILKPSKIAEIQTTVGRVLNQIKHERAEQERHAAVHRKLDKVMPIVEADIVTQLLFDHVHEVHLDEMISLLDETMRWNREVFVLVVRIHTHELPERLLQAIKLKFRQLGNGWVGAMSGGCLPIIGFLEGNRSFRSQAASIVRELIAISELSKQKQSICIGIGEPRHNLNNARYSYQEALLATAASTDHITSRYYSDVKVRDDKASTNLWGKQTEKQLQEQLRLGQWDTLTGSILQVVDQLETSGVKVHQAQQHMLEGIWIVFYELSEYGVETELPFYPFQIHTFKDLRMETERLLLRMREDAEVNRKQLQTDVVHSMKQYIVANSHRELSLEILAKEAGLSPFYISKLFKEQVGIGYIDFLTECRIEKAKKMMGIAEYSLKEIAYEVGFNDPNYFSKVFKKVCGLAPTEYRKALNGIKQ